MAPRKQEKKIKQNEAIDEPLLKKRKRMAMDEPKQMDFHRMRTRSKTSETIEVDRLNIEDNKMAKQTKFTFEPSSNKLKHIAMDEPKQIVVHRMRTRSKPNANIEHDRLNITDDEQMMVQANATINPSPKKRKRIAIEEPKKVLTVVLKRLTAEELTKHGIISTKKSNDKSALNKRRRIVIKESAKVTIELSTKQGIDSTKKNNS